MSGSGECLTLLGTQSIQSYIFASNRLRENAGASYLAWEAMEEWRKRPRGAELLFAGGGNAALLFPDRDSAVTAVSEWSLEYLKTACGLRLTAAHVPVNGSLQEAFHEAEDELERVENVPPAGFEFGALPVVRSCPSTGTAASRTDKFDGWISREAFDKRNAVEAANKRLREFGCADFEFPADLGQLGTREGASQIAIVHADGNGIGQKRWEIIHDGIKADADFTQELKDFSENVNQSAAGAFQAVVEKLRKALPALEEGEHIRLPDAGHGKRYFPLRPIVYGGDDLTFVCHGRLGLTLAVRYLEEFRKRSSFTACAGVLIMPQKFPFARGYALAEELCGSAKRKRKSEGSSEAWLDFHVLLEGATGTMDVLRQPYQSGDGWSLLKRPYSLDQWAGFERLWREFRERPRNKAKQLLEMLARGKDYSKAFLAGLPDKGRLPAAGDPAMQTTGWDANHTTAYFDPLELLDFHVDSELIP